ncbi:hypothetical protein WICPIJ_003301 [Wickerhamomyces pijperi]|uniref:Zn(2)-C6 fungal-type domain-containing protein n=1 Tax=Wickerhamomyces pijperi TaxID=599730 RepID=A0A9P8TNU4_WICPI|nr:hypothetical protein WICPIJ_003301 [Wickerhamomyces pijperi]
MITPDSTGSSQNTQQNTNGAESVTNSLTGLSILGGKKLRRKHKNSKIGCVQCKERRMKCNEELPECRNCRIRQVKIPCSYLSFTDEEKSIFIKTKEENRKHLEQSQKNSSPTTSSPESSSSISQGSLYATPKSSPGSSKTTFNLKSIRHMKPQPLLISQTTRFINETDEAINIRYYFTKLLSDSYWQFDGSFKSHFSFTAIWLHIQLKKKYDILKQSDQLDEEEEEQHEKELEALYAVGIRYVHIGVSYLRNIVDSLINAHNSHDYKTAFYLFSKMSIPTYCLQTSDILRENNLKIYYFDGSLNVVNEFFKKTLDASPVANFAAKSAYQVQKSLFIPNYPHQVLYEIRDTLRDFQACVEIREPYDLALKENVRRLISFMEEDVLGFLEHNDEVISPRSIITHTPKGLFGILFKFFHIIPSESFLVGCTDSNIHKVFYTFFYAIGRVLDNILPDTRYISQYRFIGPTTLYPFNFKDAREGLDPELLFFANYSLRVLTFFTRRADFFAKYMVVLNPFPDNLDANRFCSRKAKVQETFIYEFKKTVISQKHYPHVMDTRYSVISPSNLHNNSESSSFSTNFNTIFAMNMNFEADSLMPNGSNQGQQVSTASHDNDEELDLLDTASDTTGFLKSDYDPVPFDWVDVDMDHAKMDPMSLQKYLEDREILMKNFTSR